ncbi:MAG: hypothetical protein HY359_07600 [Candidatus Rokubacteria bacterium]|nr:hypothetical protein [Candidatus Rokubacteria bacterium]
MRLRGPRLTLALTAARSWVTATTDRKALARVLGFFCLTRLTLFIVAACAIRIVPAGIQPPTEVYLGRNLSVATWIRWDAWWYLSVVERGYWFDPDGKSNVAFFPLFPLAVRALDAVVGNQVVAGLLVANVAALGAVIAFWAWVREAAGRAAAERATLWLLVFPFSFFFHTIYAESLFFLLVTCAFLAAGRGRWPLAGLCGGLAGATRPMGILLFPAFAWALLRERRRAPVRATDVAAVLLVPAGLAAYAIYLWAAFGNPLAFWDAHAAGWRVRFHWDLAGYWRETYWILTRGPRIQGYTQLLDSLRVILPVAFIALTVMVFRRLGAPAGLYTAGAVGVGVLFAPESVGREFLAAVPAFAVAGLTDRGSLDEGLRLLSFGLLVVFLFAFVTAHFVG